MNKFAAPILSVIVPIYNTESFIRRCIDSILTQTFNDFELILVDDGSTDNSGKICDEYTTKDQRIHVIHQANSGPNCARENGIKSSRGKYIIFLDADDIFIDDKTIEENIIYLIENPDIDIVSFPQYYEKSDKSIHAYKKQLDSILLNVMSDKKQIYINWQNGSLISGGWYAKIYRRDLFNGWGFVKDIRLMEDNYHIPDLIEKCKYIQISDKGGYLYKYNPSSLIHSEFTIEKLNWLFRVKSRLYLYLLNFEGAKDIKKRQYCSLLEDGFSLYRCTGSIDYIIKLKTLKPSINGKCKLPLIQQILLLTTQLLGIRYGFKLIDNTAKLVRLIRN